MCVGSAHGSGESRPSEKMCVSACVRSTRQGKWERTGRKRNRPLIRWSQLITFSRPDGRHSSNLRPQLSGPSVLNCAGSHWRRRKQAGVCAGHRNRWVWDQRAYSFRFLFVWMTLKKKHTCVPQRLNIEFVCRCKSKREMWSMITASAAVIPTDSKLFHIFSLASGIARQPRSATHGKTWHGRNLTWFIAPPCCASLLWLQQPACRQTPSGRGVHIK